MTPAQVAHLLQQGHQARQTGQWALAWQCFNLVLAEQPRHRDASLLLGDLAHAQREWAVAVQHLQVALQQAPRLHAGWFKLGDALDELGQTEAAIDAFERALAAQPAFPEARYALARLLHTQGRAEAALQHLTPGLAAPSTPVLRAQMLQLLALLQEEAGQLEAALGSLQAGLALVPERAALHHNTGVVLQRLGRSDQALAALDRAIAGGMATAHAHYNRGNALQSLGRPEDADRAYVEALRQQPLHDLALYDLARLRWRQGRADFADHLAQAARAAPGQAVASGIEGRLMLRAQRFEAAAEAYREAARRAPQVVGYHDGLGQALAKLGRFDEALAAHRAAVQLAPQQAAPRISQAATLLQAGQASAAEAAALAAVALAPDDQQAWAWLGMAWRALGDPREHWLHRYGEDVQAYDLPPPPGWTDMGAFNDALSQALDTLHGDRQAPIDQTLRQGTQTMGNLFDLDLPCVQQLRQCILAAVGEHVQTLQQRPADDQHPLHRRCTGHWRFTDSWSSRLQRGGYHTHHVHPHGWLSACYYVALPQTVVQASDPAQPHAGWIAFGTPDSPLPGCDTQARRVVQPAVGRLVLFPSSMWHGTVPFDDEGPRLTVAFDLVPA